MPSVDHFLFHPSSCRQSLAARASAVFIGLASSWNLVRADEPVDITSMLPTLPVTLVNNGLVLPGNLPSFEIVAFNKDRGRVSWQTLGGDHFNADLASLITNVAYPKMSAFELDVINCERTPTTRLRIVLEATSTPCLVSGIDNRLLHYFSAGREIRVSSVYFKDKTRLARAGSPSTLCTAFNGQLAMIFGAPVSDMLQTTIITYDNTGSKAAVSQINFDFPTYDW